MEIPTNFYQVKDEYMKVVNNNTVICKSLRWLPKGSNLRLVARVPVAAATVHPELKKYLSPECSYEDRKKEVDNMLNRFPEFDLRNK